MQYTCIAHAMQKPWAEIPARTCG